MRFPRAARLTREGELEAVRIQGKRIRTALLEVRHLASPLHRPRVGVIVPKYGHTAVERNTVKRRLRELMRAEVMAMLPNVDVVVRANPPAYGATFEELRAALEKAVGRMARSGTDTHGVAQKGTEKHG